MMVDSPYQLVQDFVHQQYVSFREGIFFTTLKSLQDVGSFRELGCRQPWSLLATCHLFAHANGLQKNKLKLDFQH